MTIHDLDTGQIFKLVRDGEDGEEYLFRRFEMVTAADGNFKKMGMCSPSNTPTQQIAFDPSESVTI